MLQSGSTQALNEDTQLLGYVIVRQYPSTKERYSAVNYVKVLENLCGKIAFCDFFRCKCADVNVKEQMLMHIIDHNLIVWNLMGL